MRSISNLKDEDEELQRLPALRARSGDRGGAAADASVRASVTARTDVNMKAVGYRVLVLVVSG